MPKTALQHVQKSQITNPTHEKKFDEVVAALLLRISCTVDYHIIIQARRTINRAEDRLTEQL